MSQTMTAEAPLHQLAANARAAYEALRTSSRFLAKGFALRVRDDLGERAKAAERRGDKDRQREALQAVLEIMTELAGADHAVLDRLEDAHRRNAPLGATSIGPATAAYCKGLAARAAAQDDAAAKAAVARRESEERAEIASLLPSLAADGVILRVDAAGDLVCARDQVAKINARRRELLRTHKEVVVREIHDEGARRAAAAEPVKVA